MSRVCDIFDKILADKRIDKQEALTLFYETDLLELGEAAGIKKNRIHPEPIITFVVDRNINYTNICMSGCLFCAFYCSSNSPKAYVISKQDLKKKIQETIELGGTQILLQGGINPDLELDYYIDLLKFIKENFVIHIHGFSPPEIWFLSKRSSLSVQDLLRKLIDAGLNSIPGGGAEILVDEVRQKVSPNKCSTNEWLEVMRTAHKIGLRTSATMMFGHCETPEHIIDHMLKIRDLQDETKGFTAFIPWTFQPNNTQLQVTKKTSAEYLRVLALSRLVLDNIKNIQASWVTQGDKIAQIAFAFGANDLGSTMIEENVVAAAGVSFLMSKQEMIRLIKEAGYQAKQRDCFYNIIKSYD